MVSGEQKSAALVYIIQRWAQVRKLSEAWQLLLHTSPVTQLIKRLALHTGDKWAAI